MSRSGRRPGESGTREAIGRAAATLFAERGFDRTSMRAVAAAAGVDQRLVAHYFGSKQQLFVEVVELPFDPEQLVASVFAGAREGLGERLARFVVMLLESPEARQPITGMIRAAASEPEAARLVREVISGRMLVHLVEALGVDDAELRASLIGSQIVGLTMARYVVAVEPLASMPAEAVVRAIAPNLQRYMTAPLD